MFVACRCDGVIILIILLSLLVTRLDSNGQEKWEITNPNSQTIKFFYSPKAQFV